MRTSVHAFVRDVFAIYDDNILPRLIMIIMNTIILYFRQIRHTDDLTSTGIPSCSNKQKSTGLEKYTCIRFELAGSLNKLIKQV